MIKAAVKTIDTDIRHMKAALGLSRRGLGNVWPNPSVGCVIVKDGQIVGRGWTQPGGRPHAETEALRRAGEAVRGATAYVTLEPCSHHGKAPPCADALIAAGVARVVTALTDPDERVSGRGLSKLRDAGIDVVEGVCADEATSINAGFLMKVVQGRPLVTLKTATTLDGRIATSTGESQWITGAEARRFGHMIRSTHDAILVGIGTALADDPMLTCRLSGDSHQQPVRIVLDSSLKLPHDSKLVESAKEVPLWIFCLPGVNPGKQAILEDMGARVMPVQADGNGQVDVMVVLRKLGDEGITRLMVEGGGQTAASLFRADRIDRLAWFRAGGVMGADGIAGIGSYGVADLSAMKRFRPCGVRGMAADRLELYERQDLSDLLHD